MQARASPYPPFAYGGSDPVVLRREEAGWNMRSMVLYPCDMIMQSALVGIFQVSKSIYAETMPLYFRSNTFVFATLTQFEKFVTKIGPRARWNLTRLHLIWCPSGAGPRAATRLTECVKLQELTITLNFGSARFKRATSGVLLPYESRFAGMKELLKVRGLKNVDVALEWHPECFRDCTVPCTIRTPSILGLNSIDDFKTHLAVLMKPQTLKRLEIQAMKDFPMEARQVILGDAHVVTR